MSEFAKYTIHSAHNPRAEQEFNYGPQLQDIISLHAFEEAREVIRSWPGFSETELRSLDNLAQQAGVGSVWYKDESTRFELRSFKALGGAYAVFRLLQDKIRDTAGVDQVTADDIVNGKYADIVSTVTVTCATDGNHGRSVAWGAQTFGCPCVIYIHSLVSEGRGDAIAAFGAKVVRTKGNYDDAVRQAQDDAEANGWYVISDTSYEGYMEVPKAVMQGYTVMVDEALHQLPAGQRPTHVFLQGGVGGMAAAVTGHIWETMGADKPRIVIVEPEKADCLYQSAKHGEPTVVHGELDTVMAGLACGEVSLLAWEILQAGAQDFITIPDEAALECMKLLAEDSQHVVAGESAVAGLAGLMVAVAHPDVKKALGLDADSRILVFGTEGDTDPDLYERIVGKKADDIRAMRAA